MKQLGYLLILLSFWVQVDDAWLTAVGSPSIVLADDDDEYLPAERQPRQEQSGFKVEVDKHRPLIQATDFSTVRMDTPSEWSLTTPFTPPPLYVFMSLQI
jgi:hypothetical protein